MARQRKNYEVRLTNGTAVVSPTVDVFISGGVIHAAIFSDDVGPGTPLANPFVGGADGRFGFYASDGKYDVTISGLGLVTYTLAAEDFVFASGAAGGGITSINGQVGVAQTIVAGSAGTNFVVNSALDVHVLNLPTASAANRGALAPGDYTTFSSKLGNLNTLTNPVQLFSVGAAGTDFNIVSALQTHTFNIPTIGVGGSTRGLLSAADYAAFGAKQGALPAGGLNTQYLRGDLTWQTLNTLAVAELTNLYYTDVRARAAVSGSGAITYVAATGIFAMAAASGAVDGYLSAANFNIFNSKLTSINTSTVAAQTLVVGTAGTDFNISTNVGTGATTFNLPSASVANRGLVSTGAQDFAGAKNFLTHPTETVDGRNIPVDGVFWIRTSDLAVASDNTEKTTHTETWPAPITANRVWEFSLAGTLQCSGANTIEFKVYFGGTVVWASGAISPTSAAAINWNHHVIVTIRTGGGAGVVQASGFVLVDDTAAIVQGINVNTAAVNLNGTPIVKHTMQLSNSGANDTFSVSTGIWSIHG